VPVHPAEDVSKESDVQLSYDNNTNSHEVRIVSRVLHGATIGRYISCLRPSCPLPLQAVVDSRVSSSLRLFDRLGVGQTVLSSRYLPLQSLVTFQPPPSRKKKATFLGFFPFSAPNTGNLPVQLKASTP